MMKLSEIKTNKTLVEVRKMKRRKLITF